MITIVICGALAIPTTSRTEAVNSPPTCADSLQRCDFALKAALAEIEARKATDQLKDEYIQKLTTQRDKAYEAAEPGWGLPFWAWIVVGVAGGVILTRGIR